MNYLCEVVSQRPLTIHFSLLNPPGAEGPVFAPRVLGPYGLFVRGTVKDSKGKTVTEPPSLRATPKLDPEDSASYFALEPGYSFGVLFEIDGAPTAKGRYQLGLEYSNRRYTGSSDTPVGTLSFRHEVAFEIS